MTVPMTRDEAWELFCEWTPSESLRRHVLAVEACMRAYARKFGEDEERWGLVGMLHDLDYERYPDLHTGHPRYALAELERLGFVRAVVTQNIDLLHERAGSEEVVEVHGSIATSSCLGCGQMESLQAVLEQLEQRPAPICPECGSVLKPGVVMFGELLPPHALVRAGELARAAELMLVVGSTLEVWPVAGLPLEARALAIVNYGPTALDEHAVLRIDGDAGEVLGAAVDLL